MKKTQRDNVISQHSNILLNLLIMLFTLLCLLPFLLVLSVSFSSEDSITENGYQLIPKEWSVEAYQHITRTAGPIGQSYIISIVVTVVGTSLSVFLLLLCSYAMSRPEFIYRRMVTVFVLIPMLFNAGLVPLYLVVTRVLHLNDTILALILPSLINPFYILVLRSFLQFNVPNSIVESGRLEGANEFQILFRLVTPIAVPSIATVCFFTMLGYWNNWFNGLLFITKPNLLPLPNLLLRIEKDIQFLVNNTSTLGGAAAFEAIQNLPTQTIVFATVVITTGPMIMVFPFFQRYFIRGLTLGSLKA